MASNHSHLFFALAATFSIICLTISVTEALNNGFSIELIHRDSAKSPFFNATETPYQKIINAIKRSRRRANHFYPSISKDSAQSEVLPNGGEYLMTYSVGTPPVEILGIADTGSDLIWMQCEPCEECYGQVAPLFDPSKSSSYADFSCNSKQCQVLDRSSCSSSQDLCVYDYSYGDQSFTIGNVASETITLASTFGQAVQLRKRIIGCGHHNDGTFDSKGSGIVGLGGGAVSLITQMGSSIAGKFSYCLIPISSSDSNVSSKLNFGENAVVSGAGSVSTPMVAKQPSTFYFLTLEGFSVGARKLDFVSEKAAATEEGNIIIDSGTTLTFLPEDFYSELESEVAEQITARRVQGPDSSLRLCYSATPKNFDAPIITAHFSGADVKLNPVNTFVMVSDGVICFAFASMPDGAIYGNLAQMNFLVGYDLKKRTVSFKPTDCTQV